MPKPIKEEITHAYRRDTQLLFDILAKSTTNAKYCQDLLHDLLTHSELKMLKKRWYIACLLAQNKPMREIAELAGVGTDTVVRMARRLHEGSGALWRSVRQEKSPASTRKRKKPVQLRDFSQKRWVFGSGS